jgi:CHAD domain-containing protein
MRVASRRLRAALAVFEPAFHGPAYERLGREVKLVTDSLSRARDLDVMVRDLGADALRLPTTQRGAVLDLVRQWAAERRRIQGDVVAALDRLAERDPVRMFDEIAHVTGPDGSAANAGPALGSPRPGGAA